MYIPAKRVTLPMAVFTACALMINASPAGATGKRRAPTGDCIKLENLKLVNTVELLEDEWEQRDPEKGIPFKHYGPIYDAKGKKVGWDSGEGVLYVNPATGNGKEMVFTRTVFKDGSLFSANGITEEERPPSRLFTEEAIGNSGRYRGYVGPRTIEWIGQQPFNPLEPQPYKFSFHGCKVKRGSTAAP